VDQSDDDCWKTTDMGWGIHPEGIRKMLTYIQVRRAAHPRATSAYRVQVVTAGRPRAVAHIAGAAANR
jgi:hypothetical protein